jgi:allantoicase
VSHLRFHIYPDGGVARLRVHGDVVPDWYRSGGLSSEIDLAAIEHGARVLNCSDMFFGPKHNLIMPGRALNMSDGWETRRRRGPGNDWVIVQLASEGVVRRVEIDTNHFKGNFPDTCSIDGSRDGSEWVEILPRTRLLADTRHVFVDELLGVGPVGHVRLNVYPDGGVSRMRVHGIATEEGRQAAVVRRVNTLVEDRAAAELSSCCASQEWVRRVMERRPFANWNQLVDVADQTWRGLDRNAWLEAFAAHPRIGEKKAGARWSSEEQSGTSSAAPETMQALANANRAYEERFGHVYLVCATGKSADEMLELAQARLQHDPQDEIFVAAEEQRKITRLRLMKLVE